MGSDFTVDTEDWVGYMEDREPTFLLLFNWYQFWMRYHRGEGDYKNYMRK